MITKKQLKNIKKFAIEIDWNLSFKGKSKGNRHLFRIVKIAKELAKDIKVDNSIVETGSWLHDTNLEKTINGNTSANKTKIVKFLRKIRVSEIDQKKTLHCIEAHDGRINARTLEAKIVHDADTLEKMGPLGIIRETWKKSQAGWTTEKICKHLKKHLKKRQNKIHLKKAKEIARKRNKDLKSFFNQLEIQIK